jgi:hypothetical protein
VACLPPILSVIGVLIGFREPLGLVDCHGMSRFSERNMLL